MYRAPSRNRKKMTVQRPNLVPIMDAVFIFIFFLLMSANFIKVFEIPSDVPLISASEPKKPPLALTLRIEENAIRILSGVPSRQMRSFGKMQDGKYDLYQLKDFLITIKKQHLDENTLLVEPLIDITYEELISIIDGARVLGKTDEAIFGKDKDGQEIKLKTLFDNIVFTNIQS